MHNLLKEGNGPVVEVTGLSEKLTIESDNADEFQQMIPF